MVNYNEISILLLKGIQELSYEIEKLKIEMIKKDEIINSLSTALYYLSDKK